MKRDSEIILCHRPGGRELIERNARECALSEYLDRAIERRAIAQDQTLLIAPVGGGEVELPSVQQAADAVRVALVGGSGQQRLGAVERAVQPGGGRLGLNGLPPSRARHLAFAPAQLADGTELSFGVLKPALVDREIGAAQRGQRGIARRGVVDRRHPHLEFGHAPPQVGGLRGERGDHLQQPRIADLRIAPPHGPRDGADRRLPQAIAAFERGIMGARKARLRRRQAGGVRRARLGDGGRRGERGQGAAGEGEQVNSQAPVHGHRRYSCKSEARRWSSHTSRSVAPSKL